MHPTLLACLLTCWTTSLTLALALALVLPYGIECITGKKSVHLRLCASNSLPLLSFCSLRVYILFLSVSLINRFLFIHALLPALFVCVVSSPPFYNKETKNEPMHMHAYKAQKARKITVVVQMIPIQQTIVPREVHSCVQYTFCA